MRRTLDEHMSRIKKLSLITEDINNSNGEKIINTKELELPIEDILNDVLSDVLPKIEPIGRTVGDRDGELEPIKESDNGFMLEGTKIDINEVGLGLAAGVVLAAPKVIEMIGKGVKQLGKTVNSDQIRSAGEAATKAGIKLHHTYGSKLLWALKKIPNYKNMPEEKQKAIADGILLAATVAAGISAVNGVQSAIEAGHQGLAAFESGLGGVKGAEIAGAARLIIPNILNGIFK